MHIIVNHAPPEYKSAIERYSSALQQKSSCNFSDSAWFLFDREGTRKTKLDFSKIAEILPRDAELVKAFIVFVLLQYGTVNKAKNVLQQIKPYISFLSEKNFNFTMFSSSVIGLYRDWLDVRFEKTSPTMRNRYEAFLPILEVFLRDLGALGSNPINYPRPRKEKKHSSRKAPEKACIRQLDRYFWNFENDIPTDIRAVYLLGRFFVFRTCEPLLTHLDGIENDGELAVISVPTTKEAPGTVPKYDKYPLLANGEYEAVLLRALFEQQQFAKSVQNSISDPALKNRLFVSTKNPKRLLSGDDINNYLKKTVQALDIRDANGNYPKITYYSLRHIRGVELTDDITVPLEFTEDLFCHQRIGTVTEHYSRPADRDLMDAQDSSAFCAKPQIIPQRRFEKMSREMDVRLHGNSLLCLCQSCKPRYQTCWSCKHFTPDSKYSSDAEEVVRMLEARIAEIAEIKGSDSNLISSLQEQINAYKSFLALC